MGRIDTEQNFRPTRQVVAFSVPPLGIAVNPWTLISIPLSFSGVSLARRSSPVKSFFGGKFLRRLSPGYQSQYRRPAGRSRPNSPPRAISCAPPRSPPHVATPERAAEPPPRRLGPPPDRQKKPPFTKNFFPRALLFSPLTPPPPPRIPLLSHANPPATISPTPVTKAAKRALRPVRRHRGAARIEESR